VTTAVAELAVATGLPLGDLLELDDDLVDALLEAHRTRWGQVEELLATIAELLDRSFRLDWQYAHRHARSRPTPPRPLVIRRPTDPAPGKGRRISFRALEAALRRSKG
jgi:hypothetical protein